MDVAPLIEWSQAAFPYDGPSPVPSPELQQHGPVQAAAQLAKAYEHYERGSLKESGVRYFAYGLTTMGTMLMERGDSHASAAAFQAALQAFATVPPGPKVDNVVEHCRRSLRRLGFPEIAEAPERPDQPVVSLAELLGVAGPSVSPSPDAEATESPKNAVNLSDLAEGLGTYLELLSEHSHLSRRSFGQVWRRISQTADFPQGLPSDRSELVSFARGFRTPERGTAEERADRAMKAALLNFYVCRRVDSTFQANEPQLRVDLVRYTGAVLDLGLQEASRDLILGCVEAQVAAAHGTPLILLQSYALLDTLLGSVGTYLLLAGPSPAQAYGLEFDERVYRPGDETRSGPGRGAAVLVSRPLWPVHLLKQWQHGPEAKAASFALASVAGWDRSRARWVLEQVYAATPDPDAKEEQAYWQGEVDRLLTAVSRVEVMYNPWAPRNSDTTQSSVITSDEAGRFWVPDPVLKAAVAQGLGVGDSVKVRGETFEGRRMPTYLLTNQWGPVSILKIDYADRVAREEENFHRYAEKRLHQKYRPSRCEAYDMEMYLGEEGAPLRAIVTSYAFEEYEEALTLGTWFKTADMFDAADVVDSLLFTTLRSWIKDIRRDRIDLRAEYPVFRSRATLDKQSPNSWAGSEIKALTDPVVKELLGLQLPGQDEPSVTSLLGKSLGLSEATVRLGEWLKLVNPLWFAASVAELNGLTLAGLPGPKTADLKDYETLLVLAHGDLHMDNVLCPSRGPSTSQAILIDFESTHYGHVCKDFARLEACILTHVFTWSRGQAGRIAEAVVSDPKLAPPFNGGAYREKFHDHPDASDQERLVLSTVHQIRKAAFGCGQGNWPIPPYEYQLALAGSLIPMIRSTGMVKEQRQFALTLSILVCSALLNSWQQEPGHR
ncbi:hypothetical protein ACFY9F_36285 [Streptomyces sp. NPDC012421]|uniref:hypothetical protein n=1 Tax=Streptomyces sp. NPDC012421 TaxID=3364832 RepID=UPI0036EBEA72